MSSSPYELQGSAAVVKSASLQKTSNLSDLASSGTARNNLGLGSAAVANTGDFDAAGAAESVASQLPNQDVSSGSSPVFDGANFTNVPSPFDQSLNTGDDPAFAGLTIAGDITFGKPNGQPEVDFWVGGVGGTRKGLFGYDANAARFSLYNDSSALGLILFDSGVVAIGNDLGVAANNSLQATSAGVAVVGTFTVNGYKVVYSGSVSVTGTATTSFVVNIGVTQANSTYKVNVTPTSLVAAAVFYVTAKSTTQFTVTYLAGLTGAVAFDWSVIP